MLEVYNKVPRLLFTCLFLFHNIWFIFRPGAESVHHIIKAKHGFEMVSCRIFRKTQQHLFSP